jgi:hypothetical protein
MWRKCASRSFAQNLGSSFVTSKKRTVKLFRFPRAAVSPLMYFLSCCSNPDFLLLFRRQSAFPSFFRSVSLSGSPTGPRCTCNPQIVLHCTKTPANDCVVRRPVKRGCNRDILRCAAIQRRFSLWSPCPLSPAFFCKVGAMVVDARAILQIPTRHHVGVNLCVHRSRERSWQGMQ